MPPALGLIGSALAPVVGGLVGNAVGGGNRDKANAINQQILDEINAQPTPQLKQYALEKYKSAGQLTPQMEQLVSQGASGMGGIAIDPRLKDAQMGALAKMQQLGQGGLQPADQAALSQITRGADQDAQAKSAQILQDAQQRGEGGSGASLAAQLMGAQQGADRQAQQSMGIGANVSQAALQALMNAGNLGSQMQNTSFGEQAQQAQAQDAINRFNAQNQQGVNAQNTNIANYGQQYNLQNAQSLMDRNTALGNQEQQMNNQLRQNEYDNQMRKLGLATGQQKEMAGQQLQQGQQQAQNWSNIGTGVGGAFTGYASNAAKAAQAAPAGAPKPPDYGIHNGYNSLTDADQKQADKDMGYA